MFRLRKKHASKQSKPPPADAHKLLREQSLRQALIGAATIVLLSTILWLWLTSTTGKFFPWFGVFEGVLIGIAVQRLGRGLDRRFPLLAALAALIGSFAGGFMVALSTTEAELQASAVRILGGITSMTWETYFDEVVTPVDYIYAFSAAALAAFFAPRRLQRHEAFALRTLHLEKNPTK